MTDTTAKHTPGRHIVAPNQRDHGESLCIQTAQGRILACIPKPLDEQDYANAELFAAAPGIATERDGLKVLLIEARKWLGTPEERRTSSIDIHSDLLELIDAALASKPSTGKDAA